MKLDRTGAAVFKEYKVSWHPKVAFGVLREMVAFLESLSFDTGSKLVGRAAWPVGLVCDGGVERGFLMPEVPAEFTIDLQQASGRTARKLAGFQHLLNSDGFLARRKIPVSDRDRFELLADVVEALGFFHANGIVVGDFSPKNLLFSLNPHRRCYFVDCDAMTLHGHSALPQLETPDWDIRQASHEPLATPHTDTYKLALLALRLFARDQTTRNPNHLPQSVPANVRSLIERGLDPDPARRPASTEWATPLHTAAAAASTTPPQPNPTRSTTTAAPTATATHTTPRTSSPRAATVQRPGSPGGSQPSPRSGSRVRFALAVVAVLAAVALIGNVLWNPEGNDEERPATPGTNGSEESPQEEPPVAQSELTVRVVNTTSVVGTGANWACFLRDEGGYVTDPGQVTNLAGERDQRQQTMVMFAGGLEREAAKLAGTVGTDIPVEPVLEDASLTDPMGQPLLTDGVQLLVVLGTDLAGSEPSVCEG